MKRIFFYQRCIKLIFFVFGSLTLFGSANAANTGDLFMSEGESLVIKKKQNIDTVFVSNPAVADYKIVDHNTVIIYAKAEGKSEFTFFEPNQNISYHATVMVDNIIKVVSDKIRMLYPESQVQIEKIGKSYLLTGMAPTEEVRDNIVRMVGESIQSPKSNDKDTVSVRLGMSDKGDASETTENVNSSLTNKVYERLINQIQLPVSNQVNVKLSIVEVSKEFKDNIGFEWANLGTFSFHKFNFTADRITHLVNALQDDSIARVLAEPNLSVLSGESASFLVGGEIPYVKDRDASNRASIDFKEFGIKLSVTAKVNENKRIKVMLSEEISSVIGNTKAEEFTMPSLKKRRANTTVELADGESFVLGGLMNQEEQEALQKVPFIGDIPILGSFFRHTKTNNRSIELIVVATVNLVKPIPSKEITLPDFMKTSSIARFLNLSVIKNISQKKEAEAFLGKGGFIQ